MVFTILRKSAPIINEAGLNGGVSNYSNLQYIMSRIIQQIKNTPELVGILDTVVTDHFMGDVNFYAKDGRNSLGPTQQRRAEEFFEDNLVLEIFQGLGWDYFMGDAYVWHPTIATQNGMKEMQNLSIKLKEFVKEEMNMPRKFGYVPASTMDITYDLTDIKHYTQTAQGKQIKYSTDEITHLKLIEFNGEIQGLSGLKALSKEIAMMYLLKENILSQLDNGGSPDSIIYLKNSTGMSKARFERLKLALESFSHIKNAHGNLAVDGDVGVHPLSTSLKDMEYRELAMFVVSEFLLAIGVPTTRVSLLMQGAGGATNTGNLAGDAEQAYQKKINSRRLQWERRLNPLFRKLGFTFKFRRDNVQDEVRETQATQMRYSSVGELQRVLNSAGKQLKEHVLLEMLSGTKINVQSDDVEDADMELLQVNAQAGNSEKGKKPVTDPKDNVEQARSEGRTENATNRGISS